MAVSSNSAFSECGAFSPSATKKEANSTFLVTLSAMLALLAKKTSSKQTGKPSSKDKPTRSPKSPLAKPKQLLNCISHKAITFLHHPKKKITYTADREWGDGGVWQKTIIMGEKCQPLDFSGVIYYDSKGNQLVEVPIKSPRATPMPGYLTRHQM